MSITVSANSIKGIITPFVQERGLTCQVQSGWVQVAGKKGRKVYVQKRDNVSLIKLSGFEMEHPGLETDPKPETAQVKQRIVMSSEQDVLETLKDVLEHLTTLGDRPAIPRSNSSSAASSAKTDWTIPAPQPQPEA